MITIKTFRTLALSFPETLEQPHFEKASFRVNKKIFATLSEEKKEVTIKFSAVDQSVYCSIDPEMIYPANGKWGKQGWTKINLKKIKKALLLHALTMAYCEVAPRRLSEGFSLCLVRSISAKRSG